MQLLMKKPAQKMPCLFGLVAFRAEKLAKTQTPLKYRQVILHTLFSSILLFIIDFCYFFH
jgi:hypothetical protein